ncbi:hypothetical protein ACOMHN_033626 [Nucella lapillus]
MKGKMPPAIAAFTLLLTVSLTFGQQAEVLQTTLGPIQGLRKSVQNGDVDVYYGIPFAKPPVGELRFRRPEPAEPWTDVRATVTKPNACFQTIDTQFNQFPGVDMWNPNTPRSEDCLYLNVWVPRAFGRQPPRATMVWIYGGGFTAGSSALDVYDGSKLAVSQNVIVASMNYRVGPLGFLYTGTLDAPGNQGLLDQALALKWIYDNVAGFGGQQNSITIFGESAGSISVGYHLLSPVSSDYFTRAIMQSGSPLSDTIFMTQPEALRRANKLSATFSCPESPMAKLVDCLRNVDAENVTNAQWALQRPGIYIDLPSTPVVDDYFLKEDPHTLLAKGTVKDTQLLNGVNTDEGMYFLLYSFPDLFPFNNSGAISDADFKKLVSSLNLDEGDAVDKAVLYEYVERVVPSQRHSYRAIADDISGDRQFICPVINFATAFTALKGRRAVYLYSFEHNLSNNPWPDWMGVMHGYEIEAVFGLPRDFNYTQEELALADRMMGYWTRFAQTGSPNGGEAVVWPQLTRQEAQYLKITGQGDTVGQGLRRDPCTFRSTVLPLLESVKKSSECPTTTNGQGMIAMSCCPMGVFFCSVCVSVLWLMLAPTGLLHP